MVEYGISEEEHSAFIRKLRVGLSLFVGGSMALVVVHGDGGTVPAVLAFLAGTIVGAVLAWWLVPDRMGRPYSHR